MSWIPGCDVSQYQGNINWPSTGIGFTMIKVSGGDNDLYFDSKAGQNYSNAKAAGKGVGMYHFAGAGDPISEANFFVRAVTPIQLYDVLALDWEVSYANPPAWVQTFVEQVHNLTGIWPFVYMNSSTANAYNWDNVFNRCGLWVANWSVSPGQPVPVKYPYVMHQYTSSGSLSGIGGRVDLDAFFGSIYAFLAYGYQPAAPAPATTPPPTPAPAPPPIILQPPPGSSPVTPSPIRSTPSSQSPNSPSAHRDFSPSEQQPADQPPQPPPPYSPPLIRFIKWLINFLKKG